MKKISLLFLLSLIVIIAGCASNQANEKEINKANLVASEKTLPENFGDLSYQSNPKGFQAELVKTEDVYQDSWKDFQLEGEIPEIDFKANNVLFIGMFESGSCPQIIESLNPELDKSQLTIKFEPLGEVCTADLSPRNFVIAINKKISSEVTKIQLISDQTENEVPISTKTIENEDSKSSSEDSVESEGLVEEIRKDGFLLNLDKEERQFFILTEGMEKEELDLLKVGQHIRVEHASALMFSEPSQTTGISVEVLEE